MVIVFPSAGSTPGSATAAHWQLFIYQLVGEGGFSFAHRFLIKQPKITSEESLLPSIKQPACLVCHLKETEFEYFWDLVWHPDCKTTLRNYYLWLEGGTRLRVKVFQLK